LLSLPKHGPGNINKRANPLFSWWLDPDAVDVADTPSGIPKGQKQLPRHFVFTGKAKGRGNSVTAGRRRGALHNLHYVSRIGFEGCQR
jgi:hypothetical protein